MAQGSSPKEDLDLPEDYRGLDDAVRSRWKFARRFVEGIRKLARNAKGDRRKKTGGLAVRLLEVAGVCGKLFNVKVKPKFEKWREPLLRKFWSERWLDRLYHRIRVAGQQLSVGKPPRWQVNRPYHRI
ncbi:hypothetical protein B296_00050900 [Ensete ventricosum]|uniref:Uncharacterized protein n=1 Tax=Ensete ventricosum TaxID=4639 RepID=A0A426X7I0_ENSVE|nr:hypothetical protein B296_00050900 [Ensete ventricosum]